MREQSHIFFFPFMAHGHMIPIVDMAKLFASRGFKTTIVTTPLNKSFISKPIQRFNTSGLQIDVKIIKFPTIEAGLPEGCEHIDFITSRGLGWDLITKFLQGIALLQEHLEQLLRECRPDCLVADALFPWATEAASKFGVPTLVFHGTSCFSQSASISIELYKPHKNVSSDSQLFLIPNFPGDIKLSVNQLPIYEKSDDVIAMLVKASRESELKSFGVVFNSFYELEPAYADHYRNVLGRRAWYIGPVSLCNSDIEDKARRAGKEASVHEQEFLNWLNSKKPNSVLYICFGSATNFDSSQLKEIANALESSKKEFIWVVRKNKNPEEVSEDWLPEGFEERMEGKGLIIRGWAPQLLILDHEAIGGFVTHCGWNSTLEGITAGVPMITWPVGSEQFYNEKLVTQVLKIGVSVGVQEWTFNSGDSVKSEVIKKAIDRIMEGTEAEEIRNNAKKVGKMAREAVEDGGSSFSDLDALIHELTLHRH